MIDAESYAQAIGQAQQALAHRIRNVGDETPESVAHEFITALIRQGWRPTNAVRTSTWKAPAPPKPEVVAAGVEAAREALKHGRGV